MLLTLLPATVEGRFGLVLLLTLSLLPVVAWSASWALRRDSPSRRQGVGVFVGLLLVLVGLWWWLLQTRVIVAGWHTVVR